MYTPSNAADGLEIKSPLYGSQSQQRDHHASQIVEVYRVKHIGT